jgi:hypothetical protein
MPIPDISHQHDQRAMRRAVSFAHLEQELDLSTLRLQEPSRRRDCARDARTTLVTTQAPRSAAKAAS